MAKAALVAMQEVELSRIAAARASNGDVRALGSQMVEDRGKDTDTLKQLAQKATLDMPALDAGRKHEIEILAQLSAPALDTAYVTAILGMHDAEVDAFRAQATAGQEVELQAWVSDVLPLLEEQQERIHELARALNIPAK